MPRPLQGALWFTIGFFWFVVVTVGGSYGLSLLVNTHEAPFTLDERAYLSETYPGGTFIAPSQYKWCDGGVFRYFDSRGDVWHHNESCWRR